MSNIIYKDVKKVAKEDIAKQFIIVTDVRPTLVQGKSDKQKLTSEHLLVYRFEYETGEINYVVLGAVDKYKARTIATHETYSNWLKNVYVLLNTDRRNMTGTEEHELLVSESGFKYDNYIGTERQADSIDKGRAFISFTQEGFDLITGKQYSLDDSMIQRTVEIKDNEVYADPKYGKQLALGKKYDTNNNLFSRVSEIPFKNWYFYERHYFLNQAELFRMTLEEAKEYSFSHFERLMHVLGADNQKESQNAYEILRDYYRKYYSIKDVNPGYKIRNMHGLSDYLTKILSGIDGVLRGCNPFDFTDEDKEELISEMNSKQKQG